MATQKQVNYALVLLSQKGYSTRFMTKEFRDLGASMRERSGSVDAWLQSLDHARISGLIDALKKK